VHKLAEAPELDATLYYVATRSPVSDPYARFLNAEQLSREEMVQNTKKYFDPWDTIHEGNPQEILDRGEKVTLPPLLIMQGELDDNVRPAVQEKFANSYRKAGGECQFEIFAGCEHLWVREPGPQTDRAHEMVKQFIARQLKAKRLAA
jgi:alpha-beta hydrolase superfamily lysophospholipase